MLKLHWFRSIKIQFIIFLAAFALFLGILGQNVRFLLATLTTVVVSALTESILLYVKNKKIDLTSSSIISGLIIGFVLSSNNAWWLIIVVPVIAILGKHFVRFHDRHLFNPAAFGIFFVSFFWGAGTEWHGMYLWYILVPFGIYFAYKARKLEIVLGYVLVTILFFVPTLLTQHENILDIVQYFNYFYIFVMLIEPKTSPMQSPGKFLFGGGVAVLIFVLAKLGMPFDDELCALLIANLFVPLLNKLPNRRFI